MPPRTEEELLISGHDGAFAIADDMRSSVKNDDYSTVVVGKQVFKHVISSPPTLELSIEPDLHSSSLNGNEEGVGDICSILVENCTYDTTGSADRSGAIGTVSLQLYIAPPGWKKKALSAWKPSEASDVPTMQVLKAKTIQDNAKTGFPQKNVDVHTSTTFGDAGQSVTMKLRTFETLDGQPPKLRLELLLRMI